VNDGTAWLNNSHKLPWQIRFAESFRQDWIQNIDYNFPFITCEFNLEVQGVLMQRALDLAPTARNKVARGKPGSPARQPRWGGSAER